MTSRGQRTRRIMVLLGIGAAAVTAYLWFDGRPTSSQSRLLLLLLAMILAGVEPLVQAWDNQKRKRKGEYPLGSGIVITDLAPEGTIKIGGEIWKARSQDGSRISAGTKVKAVGRKRLTLIVQSLNSARG